MRALLGVITCILFLWIRRAWTPKQWCSQQPWAPTTRCCRGHRKRPPFFDGENAQPWRWTRGDSRPHPISAHCIPCPFCRANWTRKYPGRHQDVQRRASLDRCARQDSLRAVCVVAVYGRDGVLFLPPSHRPTVRCPRERFGRGICENLLHRRSTERWVGREWIRQLLSK